MSGAVQPGTWRCDLRAWRLPATRPSRRLAAVILAGLVACAAPALAQSGPQAAARRVEAQVAAGWFGGASLGTLDVGYRGPNPPAQVPLFTADTRITSSPLVALQAAYAVVPRVAVEGRVTLSHPDLDAAVHGDAEGAPAITVSERITRYLVEGGVAVLLRDGRSVRLVPFVSGGVGYLRELHEGQTVVDDGHAFYLGAGLKHWLLARRRGVVRTAGLRVDGRLYVLSGGASGPERPTRYAALTAGVFVGF